MKFKYNVTGLDCPNCAAKLSKLMEREEGVDSVKINYLAERLTVESSLSEEELLKHLRACAKSFDSAVKVEK